MTSTVYLPPFLSFLIANFQSFITIKLDSSNYFAWKTQVENALKATSLFHFVDRSGPIPSPSLVDISGVQTPNPEFVAWNTVDRMLLSCLVATLTPPILPHVVGSDHTHQLWTKLEEKFSLLSRSHILDLRRKIYSLNKTGTMEQYLDYIKGIIQRLAAFGTQMDDEELVFHTLNGLKSEGYDSLKQTIRTRIDDMTFSSLSSLLLAEELHLTPDADFASSILVTQHHLQSAPSHVASTSNTQSVPHLSPSGILPTSVPPLPFQFPNPAPTSHQLLPTFPTPQYNGPRFTRNPNRFKGNQFAPSQFSKSFSPGFQSYPSYQGQPQGQFGFPT